MEQNKEIKKDDDSLSTKSFCIPSKKYTYGELSVIFLLLSVVNNFLGLEKISFESFPHLIRLILIALTSAIPFILSLGFFYFLILWIMKLIRNRGKTLRPENLRIKKIINIVFIVLLIIFIISTVFSVSKAVSSSKMSPEKTVFLSTLIEKNRDFSLESDKTKIATQSFLDTITNQEWGKMHERLEHLLIATQTFQPKIDEMRLLYQQNIDLASNEQEKQAGIIYVKSIEIRDRQNKKVAELATFGLTIDWENPTEEQMAKWAQVADELGAIENEIKNAQAELNS